MREQTRDAHERLEAHPDMVAYARGEQSSDDHRRTLRRLFEFWNGIESASRLLPDD